eukprot:5303720-Pyramimonas_sp.AAC.1
MVLEQAPATVTRAERPSSQLAKTSHNRVGRPKAGNFDTSRSDFTLSKAPATSEQYQPTRQPPEMKRSQVRRKQDIASRAPWPGLHAN